MEEEEAHSSDLLAAGVVVELSTGADVAGLLAGTLAQHISRAEVVGVEQGACDAASNTWMVQPFLIDLLQTKHKSCSAA